MMNTKEPEEVNTEMTKTTDITNLTFKAKNYDTNSQVHKTYRQ